MNKPLFNEDNIHIFFDQGQSKQVELEKKADTSTTIEFEPEKKVLPPHQLQPTNQPSNFKNLDPVIPQMFRNGSEHPSGTIPVTIKPIEHNMSSPALSPSLPTAPPPGAAEQIQYSFADQYDTGRGSAWPSVMKFLGTFVLIFILSFIAINGPALFKQFNYFSTTQISQKPFTTNTPVPAPVMAESRLIIPKINVDVPITWDVTENDVTSALEKGVVHYQGTALPGQIGNVFITGHSSYYIWAAGDYKDIFALLDKLAVGDKIYLNYQGNKYVYEVSELKTVTADNLTVLNSTDTKVLSLMTCVPVGTNLKRLIVTANQIN